MQKLFQQLNLVSFNDSLSHIRHKIDHTWLQDPVDAVRATKSRLVSLEKRDTDVDDVELVGHAIGIEEIWELSTNKREFVHAGIAADELPGVEVII